MNQLYDSSNHTNILINKTLTNWLFSIYLLLTNGHIKCDIVHLNMKFTQLLPQMSFENRHLRKYKLWKILPAFTQIPMIYDVKKDTKGYTQ